MAEINIKDLIKIIKDHPNYVEKWEKDVPAEKALYIKFHDEKVEDMHSKVFLLKNGNELVLDVDAKGIVCGIEIV